MTLINPYLTCRKSLHQDRKDNIQKLDTEVYERAYSGSVAMADNPLARALDLNTPLDKHNEDVIELLKNSEKLRKFEMEIIDKEDPYFQNPSNANYHKQIITSLMAGSEILTKNTFAREEIGEEPEFSSDHLLSVVDSIRCRYNMFHSGITVKKSEKYFTGHI